MRKTLAVGALALTLFGIGVAPAADKWYAGTR